MNMDVGISGIISIGFSTVYPFYAEWEYSADRMARFWIQLQVGFIATRICFVGLDFESD